ncbi:MAG: ABC transporter ATP-binding protein [Pseudoruegeria sp.]
MDTMISVKDLSIGFHLRHLMVPAVENISFNVAAGETLGIVGESGSGKSLSARAILGLVPPGGKITGGEIIYQPQTGAPITVTGLPKNGKTIRSLRGSEIAMVFQEPMASLSPVHTIGNQIVTTLRQHTDLPKKAALDRAVELLDQVGMASSAEIAQQYAHQISGGMRQRAMIAMALSCSPRLLICDEPTTALDATTEAQIVELLAKLQSDLNMAMIFISHNIGLVSEIANRVMVMYLGQSIETGPASDVLRAPAHPYTRALLKALPAFTEAGTALATLQGSVPDPVSRPTGCPFHPRCPEFAGPQCSITSPPVRSISSTHTARCHLHD